MSCLPEVQGYSGIGSGGGADVAAPYNYGGNFKGLLVRCLNCNASRHRGGDPSMRILVRNAGRWFGRAQLGQDIRRSRTGHGLIPGLQLPKALPGLAVETHELHLLDRNVIGR